MMESALCYMSSFDSRIGLNESKVGFLCLLTLQ